MGHSRSTRVHGEAIIASTLSPLVSFFSLFFATDKVKTPKFLIWTFVTFFGYCSVIPLLGSGDIVRYVEFFRMCIDQDLDFKNLWSTQIYYTEGNIEWYSRLLSWLLAQFTSDYRIMTMVFATVFGFFYAQILAHTLYAPFLVRRDRVFLTFVAMAQIPFWSWQVVDFYTAAVVFICGVLCLYKSGSKKLYSILLIASTPFIHASFLYIALSWIALYLMRHIVQRIPQRVLWTLLFISTLFILLPPTSYSSLISSIVGNESNYIVYTSGDSSSETGGVFYTSISFCFRFLFLIWIALNQKKMGLLRDTSIYNLILVFLIVVNIFSGIPSARRFISVFMVLLIVHVAIKSGKNINATLKLTPLHILAPVVFVYLMLTYAFFYTDIVSFISGPLIAPFIIDEGVAAGGLYQWLVML
ncbi:EpsG family protein [uncultured Porphyromonas sp.]|uniref:EpsG family protein n=1 Tax=uncultured Porphyromonas sp. TaxID=159274 RepID=UPI0034281E5E